MTNIMKFAAVAMLLISAQSANAISLRFKFKTFSSGPSIYACNAGIRAAAQTGKVCYNQTTGASCTPTACDTAKEICDTQCVCSGTNGGDTLMNYMKVSYAPWTDHPSAGSAGQAFTNTVTRSSEDGGAWNALFNGSNGENEAYGNRIGDLSFNLGSELYIAEYFVDICYRGPQIEYNADNVVANFNIIAQVSATDFLNSAVGHAQDGTGAVGTPGLEQATADALKYTKLSGLQVKAHVVCDQQGLGSLQNAANNQGYYDTTINEATFQFNASKATEKLAGDLFATATPASSSAFGTTDFGSGALNLNFSGLQSAGGNNGQWLNVNNTKTPRFCKVRYVFTETNGRQTLNSANALKFNLRKWQRHGAELCTHTTIEEVH
nr:hypothetical protein CKG001_06330 [Bdellovibrio sp. CKG001]